MNKKNPLERLKEKVDAFIPIWKDSPSQMGGWEHDYFCDVDGTPLVFDLKKPCEHFCETCQKSYADDKKNSAWITIFRKDAVARMCDAMVLYKKGKGEKYFSFAKKILLFYAKNYKHFKVHIWNESVDFSVYEQARKEFCETSLAQEGFKPQRAGDEGFQLPAGLHVVGPGKILSQGLDDAILLIQSAIVFHLLKDELAQDDKDLIIGDFFKPAKSFLNSQQFCVHNITLWREVAIQILNLVSQEKEKFSIDRPVGVLDNLEIGTTRDYWWFEGSFHYHFYVIESLCYLAFMAEQFHVGDDRLKCYIQKMLEFSCQCSFSNGDLPCPNDGWPNLTCSFYQHVFELAVISYPKEKKFYELYSFAREETPGLNKNETLFLRFLFLEEEAPLCKKMEKRTRNFQDSKVSILENEQVKCFIKYGVNTKSHAHYDPFTYEASIGEEHFVRDLSNSGYGSKINELWYNTTYSHCSVILNKQKENNLFYQTDILESTDSSILLQSKNIYSAGHLIKRFFKIETDGFLVETTVSGEGEWMVAQHFDAEEVVVENSLVSKQAEEVFGLHQTEDFLKSLKGTNKETRTFVLGWETKNQQIRVRFSCDREVLFYVAKTIGNPATNSQISVYVVGNGGYHLKMAVESSSIEKRGRNETTENLAF